MATRTVDGVQVHGLDVGPETRCAHYGGPTDVIAIRAPCCDRYYPCAECHAAVADHDADRRSAASLDEPAVLCGRCGTELSWRTYLDSDFACPACGTSFNPGCARHYDRYLEAGVVDGAAATLSNE